MKRLLLSLLLAVAALLPAGAMSYEEARDRAWYLTDKMAYELNLTQEQYDRAYQINLDYLLSIQTASDCLGPYWTYRNADLRCVLLDWQYELFTTLDYFFRPVRWVTSAWYFPILARYRVDFFYFPRPTVYVSYHGHTWWRRGHSDPSPYRGWRPPRRPGMRHDFHGRPGLRPGHDLPPMPPAGRPHRPDGRPGTRPPRPGGGGDRDDLPWRRPGGDVHRPSRPGGGNGGNVTRPSRPGGNSGGNVTRPSRPGGNSGGNVARPSRPGGNNGGNVARPSRPGGNNGGNRQTETRPSQRPNGNLRVVNRPARNSGPSVRRGTDRSRHSGNRATTGRSRQSSSRAAGHRSGR